MLAGGVCAGPSQTVLCHVCGPDLLGSLGFVVSRVAMRCLELQSHYSMCPKAGPWHWPLWAITVQKKDGGKQTGARSPVGGVATPKGDPVSDLKELTRCPRGILEALTAVFFVS